MRKVRVAVKWDEVQSKFGHVEVDERYADNRAAVLDAVERAHEQGAEWDTDPSPRSNERRNFEWWEESNE